LGGPTSKGRGADRRRGEGRGGKGRGAKGREEERIVP